MLDLSRSRRRRRHGRTHRGADRPDGSLAHAASQRRLLQVLGGRDPLLDRVRASRHTDAARRARRRRCHDGAGGRSGSRVHSVDPAAAGCAGRRPRSDLGLRQGGRRRHAGHRPHPRRSQHGCQADPRAAGRHRRHPRRRRPVLHHRRLHQPRAHRKRIRMRR